MPKKIKTALPIREPKKEVDEIDKQIKTVLVRFIFKPIIDLMGNGNATAILTFSTFDKMVNILAKARQSVQGLEDDIFFTQYKKVRKNLNTQFTQTIGIKPQINEVLDKKIDEQYSTNLLLYVKNFTDEEVLKMRQDVKEMTLKGNSVKSLQEYIAERYSVTKNKASFLARQETKLYLSTYQKEKYAEAGLDKFEWVSVNDNRVRKAHKELDKQVFSWQSGAIDKKTGEIIFPGSDYNCRCVAKPVIEF